MRMLYRFRLVCIFLTIVLYACRIDDRKPSFQGIPIYPNAQRVQRDPNTELSRSVEFQTSSSTENVQAFYETELPKLGWQSEGGSGGHFGYFYPNHDGSSNYKLVLRMSIGVTENLETVVSIDQFIAYQGQLIGLNP